jgi:hypothetical protein
LTKIINHTNKETDLKAPHPVIYGGVGIKINNLSQIFGIVFPFIIWFYGSAIVIIRGWGCGFGNRREDIVA